MVVRNKVYKIGQQELEFGNGSELSGIGLGK